MAKDQKVIKLRSRGAHNYLKKLTNLQDTKTDAYLLVAEYPTIRVGYFKDDEKERFFIDPVGGPMLYEGFSIGNKKIKSISHAYNAGYIIVLT